VGSVTQGCGSIPRDLIKKSELCPMSMYTISGSLTEVGTFLNVVSNLQSTGSRVPDTSVCSL